MRICLVEDSVIIRQRLKRMLADVNGIEIIGEVADAHQATEVIDKGRPDVVLLDIQLENGSGIDVLVTVKKYKPAPAVIVLTNYPYPQYRQKCMEAGADFFFVKSSEFDQVIPTLRQLMRPGGNSGIQPVV
jgi:DNA-binding NarL/FixJ family response regulator